MGWALCFACIACGSDGYRVIVRFDGDASRAERIEVSVVRTCADPASDPPSSPLFQVDALGEEDARFAELDPGSYGLAGRAWDGECDLYAAGCAPVEVEAGGSGTLEVVLEDLAEPIGCGPDEGCAGGVCVEVECDPPAIVGTADTPGTALRIAVRDEWVFVADGPSGLQVVDVSDPRAPEIVGFTDTEGWAQAVLLREDVLFLADDTSGVALIDVGDPTSPAVVDRVPTTEAEGVASLASHVVVADDVGGLVVLDAESGAVVGSAVGPPFDAQDVVAQDGYAYFADNLDGLVVFDVTEPTSPQAVGFLDTRDGAASLAVQGRTALVADSESGLRQ